jgi:ribosome-associated protein
MSTNQELMTNLGHFLEEVKARNVVVLDVSETCSWADTFVIATYNSQGHLKGLVQELDQWASENLESVPHRPKKNQVNEWMLVDWDDTVIHLFSETARTYYELEKLWFNAKVVYATKA